MAALKFSVASAMIQISPTFLSTDLFHPGVVRQNLLSDGETMDKQMVPDHLVQGPYTSHICRFEVFPHFDPGRTEFDGKTLQHEISPATQVALEELSNSIYRETEYQKNFKPLNIQRTTTTLAEMEDQHLFVDCEKEENVEEETNDKKEQGTEDDEIVKPSVESTSTSEEKSQEGDVILTNEEKSKPACESKITSGLLAIPKKSDSEPKNTIPSPYRLEKRAVRELEYRARYKISMMLPKVTDYGKKKTYDTPPKLITLPRMPFGGTTTYRGARLMPSIGLMNGGIPLFHHRELTFIKPRLPAMVGMQFKTAAHAKYHRNHPESIPDLHQSITDGKQHFFYGIHASILR
ncbi:hypothetical protein QZH41_009424 [Actinostola sp. cb2023]|nr:hypothetical protein QZH41_009424 [Actinostola sp. cb2023]